MVHMLSGSATCSNDCGQNRFRAGWTLAAQGVDPSWAQLGPLHRRRQVARLMLQARFELCGKYVMLSFLVISDFPHSLMTGAY